MNLTPKQRAQLQEQFRRNQRESGTYTIDLGDSQLTIDIDAGVFASDLMSAAIHLARYLYHHPELYKEKSVLDVGCGAGLQGIITARRGARVVTLTDINALATRNATRNVSKLQLSHVDVYTGDLFESIPEDATFDLIIFNHPFFPAEPNDVASSTEDELLWRGMLGGTELIKRFFKNAKQYLKPDGKIVMPYFHLAGPENDPSTHVDAYGYTIESQYTTASSEGLQVGDISIYVISRSR